MADNPPESLADSLAAARRIVWAEGGNEVCVVAKGTATACVGVDIALLPKPGPSSLATAGSGDVLAGIMAASLARGANRFGPENLPLMCALACEIHGYAASIAAERFGTRGVMARDVADAAGLAIDTLEEQASYVEDPEA